MVVVAQDLILTLHKHLLQTEQLIQVVEEDHQQVTLVLVIVQVIVAVQES
jgi:hypothetical protein